MKQLLRSPLGSAVVGGLVVAGTFLALGVTGHRTTRTIVEEAPVMGQPASSGHEAPTAHQIYELDNPGVVFVRAQVVEQVQSPFDLFPQQQSSTSTGSGFLVDQRGYILTNYHVIEGADRSNGVIVQFEDNVSRKASVVGTNPSNDLALLKVDMNGVRNVRALPLGDSTTARVGDPVLAIGNPFGLERTLTSGIVSAIQRQIQAPNGFSIENVIQTDAPINPGNSGGPLIDATGKVIGINSQIVTGGGGGNGSVGIAFAIPIDTASGLLPRLEAGGQVRLAWLGVSGAPSSGGHGVTIRAQAGGPAANAGLRDGDVIEAISGRQVATMADLQAVVEAQQPGRPVTVRVRRGSAARTFRVELGSRPTQAPNQ
jgi:S1-C subfamily serine protease